MPDRYFGRGFGTGRRPTGGQSGVPVSRRRDYDDADDLLPEINQLLADFDAPPSDTSAPDPDAPAS